MMILIALLSSFLAFGQDCAEVNLITQPNSPFEKMPVLDQAGNNMCYAYVAAQLANYQLIKSGNADRPVVHPAWAGLAYKENSSDNDLRGGFPNKTLDALARGGNCSEELVRVAIKARAELVEVPEARIMKFLDNYAEILRRRGLNPANERQRAEALTAAAAQNSYCTLPRWQRLMGKPELLAQDSVSALRMLLADSCQQNRTNLPLPPYQHTYMGDDSAFEAKIDAGLRNGNPVGMTFCSWSADKPHSSPPHYVQLDQYQRRMLTADPEQCGSHVALIAGKKSIGGSCHYLYRNSRGTGWYRDVRHLTCLCKNKRTGAFVDNCKYSTHNDGNHTVEACWVPKANLLPNMFSLINY